MLPPPDTIPGYVPITDVQQFYNTSRKSVERRRDRARETGDSTTYRMFRLRTREGQVYDEPSLDIVKSLRASGKIPEWFVSREWLTAEFGPRPSGDRGEPATRPTPDTGATQGLDEVVATLRATYDARINDLKEQLAAAEKREVAARDYAERDKQRFATAASELTRVMLALPEIAQSTQRAKATVTYSEPVDHHESDKAAPTADSTIPANEAVPTEPKRGLLTRLFRLRR